MIFRNEKLEMESKELNVDGVVDYGKQKLGFGKQFCSAQCHSCTRKLNLNKYLACINL